MWCSVNSHKLLSPLLCSHSISREVKGYLVFSGRGTCSHPAHVQRRSIGCFCANLACEKFFSSLFLHVQCEQISPGILAVWQ